jgi:hypothetical protein
MKAKTIIPMAQEIVIPRSFLDAWKHRKANLIIEGFWPALESAFNEVNGKATRFTIGPLDVVDSIMRCEERLAELKVARHKRPDHIALVRQSAGPCKSYRYGSIGTCYQVTITCGHSWRLDYVKRVTVSPGAQGVRTVLMNEEMYMCAVRNFLPDVRILQSAPAIGETK